MVVELQLTSLQCVSGRAVATFSRPGSSMLGRFFAEAHKGLCRRPPKTVAYNLARLDAPLSRRRHPNLDASTISPSPSTRHCRPGSRDTWMRMRRHHLGQRLHSLSLPGLIVAQPKDAAAALLLLYEKYLGSRVAGRDLFARASGAAAFAAADLLPTLRWRWCYTSTWATPSWSMSSNAASTFPPGRAAHEQRGVSFVLLRGLALLRVRSTFVLRLFAVCASPCRVHPIILH